MGAVTNPPTGGFTPAQVPSGRWVLPLPIGAVAVSSVTLAANTATFLPVEFRTPTTIQALAARVQTGVAATNIMVAVFANGNGRPVGTALASVLGLSGATSGTNVSGAVTPAVVLSPGLYWLAVCSDGAPSLLAGTNANTVLAVVGTATLANITGTGLRITASVTYGSWPDITAVTLTEANGSVPVLLYQVA